MAACVVLVRCCSSCWLFCASCAFLLLAVCAYFWVCWPLMFVKIVMNFFASCLFLVVFAGVFIKKEPWPPRV